RARPAVFDDVLLRGVDDPQRVVLRRLAGISPGGNPMPTQDAPHGLRVLLLDLSDVEPELETRPAPGHPDDLLAVDLPGELLTIHRGSNGDTGIRVQVINIGGIAQSVYRGIDTWGSPALSVHGVIAGVG